MESRISTLVVVQLLLSLVGFALFPGGPMDDRQGTHSFLSKTPGSLTEVSIILHQEVQTDQTATIISSDLPGEA
ncbi:MAG: hypothetical protein R3222_05395, partial [Balneolaceae bacterium]|nr:hypothetical protein [Balneolaceae bacterium]